MKYAQIRSMDISDGPGIRVALYTQGCPIHCKGCHNQSTWDFNGGKEFNRGHIKLILDLCDKDYIAGLSILGGEPLVSSNFQDIASLVQQFKIRYPNKTIWLWTGFLFDNVKNLEIMNYLDTLIDGQYIDELHDFTLKYRGSSNQRVIDVQKSIKENKIILYE